MSNVSVTNSTPTAWPRNVHLVNIAIVAALLLGTACFFWSGLTSLVQAWSLPEYNHGFFIPLVSMLLMLRERQRGTQVSARSSRNTLIGTAVSFAGLFLGLLGNLAHIPDVSTYGLLLLIGGIIILWAGPRLWTAYLPAWFFLFFMLPLPNFVYWPLSIKLQLISSEFGVSFIRLMGITVFLEGNIIDLGSYQLQVAEACSGLRYLFPLMSIGFLFAILYKGSGWEKGILFLSSIPITILMNSLRIAIVGILVNKFGVAQAEGFLHFFEGWIIFVVCMAFLYLVAIFLQRILRRPQRELFDLNLLSVPEGLGRIGNLSRNIGLLLVVIAVLASGILWQVRPAPASNQVSRQDLSEYPLRLGDWRGTRATLDTQTERVLRADDYILADYKAHGTGPAVNLLVVYYKSQTEGNGIHSPEVCIPTGGWEVSGWTQVETDVQISASNLTVNRAVIQRGQNRQVVYYWFEQRGRRLTNDYVAKAFTVWDGLSRNRTDGALVRVITPILPDESVAAADDRLEEFLAIATPTLPDYVPQ